MVNVADLWTLNSSFMAQCFFLVSTSALFDPLITEKCECFSLDLAAMLLLKWRIQMLSLLDLSGLCSNSVAWSRSARAALVQADKRSVDHTITSSSVSFRLHYICHLMLGNVVVTSASLTLWAHLPRETQLQYIWNNKILLGWKNGPMNCSVQKCVPKTKPKASYRTVQYEYVYRYTLTH